MSEYDAVAIADVKNLKNTKGRILSVDFGEVLSAADQDVVNAVRQGDKIVAIEIHDDCADLFEEQARNIERWNSMLKK